MQEEIHHTPLHCTLNKERGTLGVRVAARLEEIRHWKVGPGSFATETKGFDPRDWNVGPPVRRGGKRQREREMAPAYSGGGGGGGKRQSPQRRRQLREPPLASSSSARNRIEIVGSGGRGRGNPLSRRSSSWRIYGRGSGDELAKRRGEGSHRMGWPPPPPPPGRLSLAQLLLDLFLKPGRNCRRIEMLRNRKNRFIQ